MKNSITLLVVDKLSHSAVKLLLDESKYSKRFVFVSAYSKEEAIEYASHHSISLLLISRVLYKRTLCELLFKERSLCPIASYEDKILLAPRRLVNKSLPSSQQSVFEDKKPFTNSVSVSSKVFKQLLEDFYENNVLDKSPKTAPGSFSTFHSIIGSSPSIKQIFRRVEKIAKSDSNVLILGESGTGKELVANAIHQSSRYKDGPFIAINCAAIPRELLESELFGHTRGSFTGAIKDKSGYFMQANSGTLFLDEIGDLSFDMQVKLLRVLETKEIRAIGSDKLERIDLRIVSATHRDLSSYIDTGRFREDLYYRLNVFTISLPSLRERKSDIPILVQFFLNKLNDKYHESKALSKNAMKQLVEYHWKGNVRELKNVAERMFSYCDGEIIDFIPDGVFQHRSYSKDANKQINNFTDVDKEYISLADGEKHIITNVLSNVGNITKSAKRLGISRDTLYRKMKLYDISYERIKDKSL